MLRLWERVLDNLTQPSASRAFHPPLTTDCRRSSYPVRVGVFLFFYLSPGVKCAPKVCGTQNEKDPVVLTESFSLLRFFGLDAWILNSREDRDSPDESLFVFRESLVPLNLFGCFFHFANFQ